MPLLRRAPALASATIATSARSGHVCGSRAQLKRSCELAHTPAEADGCVCLQRQPLVGEGGLGAESSPAPDAERCEAGACSASSSATSSLSPSASRIRRCNFGDATTQPAPRSSTGRRSAPVLRNSGVLRNSSALRNSSGCSQHAATAGCAPTP
eukprot:5307903-Pleurochrysis_carterae.AAC.1